MSTRGRVGALVGAALSLAAVSCSDAPDKVREAAGTAVQRAAKESFCIRWRVVKEAVELRDNEKVAAALRAGGKLLVDQVPEAQRGQLETAVDKAKAAASAADRVAGDAARAQAASALAKVSGQLNEYCKGTLTG